MDQTKYANGIDCLYAYKDDQEVQVFSKCSFIQMKGLYKTYVSYWELYEVGFLLN